jgi:dTDP-4-dehydrorhamnose 3,5-epimerase
MQIKPTNIPGCLMLGIHQLHDVRGQFTKLFSQTLFRDWGLETTFLEYYATQSHHGVIRGLHFQIPPMEHTKLVCCLHGNVFDAVLDIRQGSPTYGQHETFHLSDSVGELLYIPPGLAHGFCVLSTVAVLLYMCTTEYSSSCDTGILWNSAGIPWPTDSPLLSDRDRKFKRFEDFQSPFAYHPSSHSV